MARKPDTYTVDASVLLKLVVEEEYSLQATKLASDFGDGRIALYAPAIIDYEIGAVLYKLVAKKIIEPKYAHEAFGRLLKLPIVKVAPADYVSVLRLASDMGIHYYDCLYIAVARESNSTLISSDEKLVKVAKKALSTAIHIRDFESSSL